MSGRTLQGLATSAAVVFLFELLLSPPAVASEPYLHSLTCSHQQLPAQLYLRWLEGEAVTSFPLGLCRSLELGTEGVEQLFCHHCSKLIPACACLAKDSAFMALLLVDNQAGAVKQEFIRL